MSYTELVSGMLFKCRTLTVVTRFAEFDGIDINTAVSMRDTCRNPVTDRLYYAYSVSPVIE
jgi:hypothetical protein